MIVCTNSSKENFFPKGMSANDTTGVERRHLFQTVAHDIRILPRIPGQEAAAELPPSANGELLSQSLSQVMGACWPQQLEQLCSDASLSNRYGALHAAAQQLGVAWWCELVEVAEELMDLVKLTPLERRRFNGQLGA